MNKYLKVIQEAMEKKLAQNIVILDISEISSVADYFVIANGTNTNQVQAISDEVCAALAKEELPIKTTEGYQTANWILLDYGDIIVHIFDQESRDFYRLESNWKDGKEVEI